MFFWIFDEIVSGFFHFGRVWRFWALKMMEQQLLNVKQKGIS